MVKFETGKDYNYNNMGGHDGTIRIIGRTKCFVEFYNYKFSEVRKAKIKVFEDFENITWDYNYCSACHSRD